MNKGKKTNSRIKLFLLGSSLTCFLCISNELFGLVRTSHNLDMQKHRLRMSYLDYLGHPRVNVQLSKNVVEPTGNCNPYYSDFGYKPEPTKTQEQFALSGRENCLSPASVQKNTVLGADIPSITIGSPYRPHGARFRIGQASAIPGTGLYSGGSGSVASKPGIGGLIRRPAGRRPNITVQERRPVAVVRRQGGLIRPSADSAPSSYTAPPRIVPANRFVGRARLLNSVDNVHRYDSKIVASLPRIKSLLDEIVPTLLAVSGVDTSSTDTFGKCIAYLKKLSPTARTPAFGKAAEQLKRHGMDLCELFIQICNLYKIYNCDVGIIALKLEENVTGGGGCYAGHRNRLLEALRHCLDANCGAGLSAPLTFKVLELRNILSRIF